MARGMCQFDVTTISERKPCAFGPAPGLDRIAERVERAVEVDAAAHHAGEFRIEASDFPDRGGAVDAADQQPLAAPGRQQLDRVGDARGAAGQRHDAVGIAVERDLLGRHREPTNQKQSRPRERQRTRADRDRIAGPGAAPQQRSAAGAPPRPSRRRRRSSSVLVPTIGIVHPPANHTPKSGGRGGVPAQPANEWFRACG